MQPGVLLCCRRPLRRPRFLTKPLASQACRSNQLTVQCATKFHGKVEIAAHVVQPNKGRRQPGRCTHAALADGCSDPKNLSLTTQRLCAYCYTVQWWASTLEMSAFQELAERAQPAANTAIGISQMAAADPSPDKIDLSVGAYRTEVSTPSPLPPL